MWGGKKAYPLKIPKLLLHQAIMEISNYLLTFGGISKEHNDQASSLYLPHRELFSLWWGHWEKQ